MPLPGSPAERPPVLPRTAPPQSPNPSSINKTGEKRGVHPTLDRQAHCFSLQLHNGIGQSARPSIGGLMANETATLGGGCFWCLEAVYQELNGVTHVESGYTGGHLENPVYEQICSGTTGHAEVVRIEFDNEVISYRDLLEVFFTVHDPTTPNRQGADVGTQYRSVIYYETPEQHATAKQVIAEMANVWDAPIVTELSLLGTYYKAEAHHQSYFRNHPLQGYCAFVVAPKISKLRKTFGHRVKTSATP
jgi:peptide-methionine (S)-S-oxide reductase